jgi:hypothetical protein
MGQENIQAWLETIKIIHTLLIHLLEVPWSRVLITSKGWRKKTLTEPATPPATL